jgi:RNA polymerase sigma factor (sigma-70 family)
MAGSPLHSVVRFVRALAVPVKDGDATDRHLLRRYWAERDDVAFATLVKRYGPMVWGVCQRVLGNHADADDVFQATFLVLARKAGSLSKPERLGNWLYGVAYRTAIKARSQRARRQVREREAAVAVVADAPKDRSDVNVLLDEEVNRLPEKYRVPVILCYFMGQTTEEVGKVLGCPRGTVLSRLAGARDRLCRRLLQRGVLLSAAGVSAALSSDALAAEPSPALIRMVVQGDLVSVTGQIGTETIAAEAARLGEAVMRDMWLSRLRYVIAWVMSLALLAAGTGLIALRAFAEKEVPPGQEARRDVGQDTIRYMGRVPLDVNDLVDVTGLNVYKFRLDMAKGQLFRLSIREVPAKDAPIKHIWSHDFKATIGMTDLPNTYLRLSFLRLDRKLQGVLLSQEKETEFRVYGKGIEPHGLATIITNPLGWLPGTEKILVVDDNFQHHASVTAQGDIRLLVIYGLKQRGERRTPDMGTFFPRAEVVVSPLSKSE